MNYWYGCYKPGTSVGLSGTDCTGFGEDTLLIVQKLRGNNFTVAVRLITDNPYHIGTNGSHTVSAEFGASEKLNLTMYIGIEIGETPELAKDAALALVDRAVAQGYRKLYDEHCAAWENFWEKSFISLPKANDFFENLWYLNLYYANSEMKGKYPAHFCNGIWNFYHDFVPWNMFFHYNMQLATFPLEAANHPELLNTYYDFRFSQLPLAMKTASKFKNSKGAFYTDVCDGDGKPEVGTCDNCTCGAQLALYLYNHYLYSGDKIYLKNKALPMLRQIGLFYLDNLKRGDDGYYHIYRTTGYEGSPLFDDSITDHAMIRALFRILIKELPSEEGNAYRERLEHLAPYGETEMYDEEYTSDGFFLHGIGKGTPIHGKKVLTVGKRCDNGEYLRRTFGNQKHDYYGFPDSEMAPVFPSGLVGIKDRGTALYDEIYNSICLHHPSVREDNVEGKDASDGSCMGWCMMPIYLARMGLGDFLQTQLENTVSTWMIYPQGFGTYGPLFNHAQMIERFHKNHPENTETHERYNTPSWNFRHFDYETLPILAASVNEMLLQSYDGTVRLFGAVHQIYSAAFSLKAVGGFTVNGIYDNGSADVWIFSERGENLTLALEHVDSKVRVTDEIGTILTVCNNGETVAIPTDTGKWIHIATENKPTMTREYRRNEDVKTQGNAQLGTWKEFE